MANKVIWQVSRCANCVAEKLEMVKQCYYQNVFYVAVKNQDLWKNKKQKEY